MENLDVDEIVNQLKADNAQSNPAYPLPTTDSLSAVKVTDENVEEVVYDKASQLIEISMSAVMSLKDSVCRGGEAKEIAALGSLIGAATKAIETLNKINLQKKEGIIQKDLKKMEVEASKNFGKNLLENGGSNNTTNIVITTREKMLESITEKVTRALPGKRDKENVQEAEILQNPLLEAGE